jgi:hypothetical protein
VPHRLLAARLSWKVKLVVVPRTRSLWRAAPAGCGWSGRARGRGGAAAAAISGCPVVSGRSAGVPGELGRMPRLAVIAYVVIGVLVASQHSYYAHLATLSQVLSAVVATALWPLVLLGANLHLSLANP